MINDMQHFAKNKLMFKTDIEILLYEIFKLQFILNKINAKNFQIKIHLDKNHKLKFQLNAIKIISALD